MGLTIPPAAEDLEGDVLPRARDQEFALIQRELDTGQVVWLWRLGNEPGPGFLTRREALSWMAHHLNSNGRHVT